MASEKEVQHRWVMHWNQTQHLRNSIWDVNAKKKKKKTTTQMVSINNPRFLCSHPINRQRHWRYRNNIIEWCIEIKLNTHWNWSLQLQKKKKQHTNGIHLQSTLPIQSTGNIFRNEGVSLLSEALKTNTALLSLCLSCKQNKSNTKVTSINNSLFRSHQINS